MCVHQLRRIIIEETWSDFVIYRKSFDLSERRTSTSAPQYDTLHIPRIFGQMTWIYRRHMLAVSRIIGGCVCSNCDRMRAEFSAERPLNLHTPPHTRPQRTRAL